MNANIWYKFEFFSIYLGFIGSNLLNLAVMPLSTFISEVEFHGFDPEAVVITSISSVANEL